MAEIYLGLTISGATLLPPIRWEGGGTPTFPIDYSKQVDRAGMLSGAQRFNFRSHHPRRWPLAWEMLTAAELATFLTLNGDSQELYFQNNWEDATWRQVVIVSFGYEPYLRAGATGCRYGVNIVLEEVVP
jgi:hypothetical protein